MATYITFKCDGRMPPGSAEPCRAGFSVQPETWIADDFGGLVSDVDKAMDQAAKNGWTQDWEGEPGSGGNPGLGRFVQFCPSCTRHRAEAARA
jgi:hypothetical protein